MTHQLRREAVMPSSAREAREISGKRPEIRTASAREIRAVADGDTVRLTGRAIVFNSPSLDMGGWYEVIKPGACDAVLAASPDVRFLVNHTGLPLARTTNGSLSLAATAGGLDFDALLAAVQASRDLATLVERRDLDQMSYAFTVAVGGDTWTTDADGRERREIHQFAEIDEISGVTFPAYPASYVEANRSAGDAPEDEAPVDEPAYRGRDIRIAAYGA